MKKIFFLFILSTVIVCFGAAQAADKDPFTPWEFGKPAGTTAGPSDKDVRSGRILSGVMGLYSRYISAVDGDRCSMHPNCSVYSAQAFRKHGVVIGALMTADRLIHESDESGLAPKVNVNGRVLNYDPVSNNDFWWNGKDPAGFDK